MCLFLSSSCIVILIYDLFIFLNSSTVYILYLSIQVNKFYDKLRSKAVISYEDYQEIDNSKIHHTDSEKASK